MLHLLGSGVSHAHRALAARTAVRCPFDRDVISRAPYIQGLARSSIPRSSVFVLVGFRAARIPVLATRAVRIVREVAEIG
eukprot:2461099-Prymnesium_polylepis.1